MQKDHLVGVDGGGVPQWQPIETAPKDGSVVLGYWVASLDGIDVTGDKCYALTLWMGGEWVSADDCDISFADPTHWMPLPTPPQGGAA